MTNRKEFFGAGTCCSESTRTQRDPRVPAALIFMLSYRGILDNADYKYDDTIDQIVTVH